MRVVCETFMTFCGQTDMLCQRQVGKWRRKIDMKLSKRMAVSIGCGLFLCISAFAQGFSASSSAASQVAHFKPEQIQAFSKKVEQALGETGARVAIVARMGRPASELPEGMHFTHVAFAVQTEIPNANGEKSMGYAMQNLYQEDDHLDVSDLVQDFPVDFFKAVVTLESGLIIPSPELQAKLLKVISSPTYRQLHQRDYSVIANPYTLGRQNCTEFVLDVLNAAIYQTSDIHAIKAHEKADFVAQPVNVSAFKLLLGAMFSSEVFISDHPGWPATATFERLADYLKKYDPSVKVTTVYSD